MRIGLAQINSTLGDFQGNREKILKFIIQAKGNNCDLVVFPELCLFGYLPMDMLERKSIVVSQLKEFKKLEKKIPKGISILLGLVTENETRQGKPFHNSAVLLRKGEKPKSFAKELLPSYDIFDETRHFEAGDIDDNIVKIGNQRTLITICEDIWGWGQEWRGANYPVNPLLQFKKQKLDLVINISASPYSMGKRKVRAEVVKQTANALKAPVIYVNLVGAQDEVIFDGGSLVVDKKGKLISESPYFEENLKIVELENAPPVKPVSVNEVEHLFQSLVLGIRDFVKKTGLKKVHLGSSGGIDSAVVACLAVEAIGNEKVSTIALPGPFSSPESLKLARKLAQNLDCKFLEASINESYETSLSKVSEAFGKAEFGVMNESLQSRLRGMFLMAYSNKESSLLLTTGNKSEYATGYCTIYGDMCGGLAPIGDLLKRQVYELAKFINRQREIIPSGIIKRPPTAELRPNQKDQDSLPPYEKLDRAVENIVENCKPANSKEEKWLLGKLVASEFKRWQAPPILRISRHAFGRGRRWPVALVTK